jgi:hypothetical protein
MFAVMERELSEGTPLWQSLVLLANIRKGTLSIKTLSIMTFKAYAECHNVECLLS